MVRLFYRKKRQSGMNSIVTIYTSTMCPVCRMVKDFLDMNHIAYQEVSIDLNPLAMISLIRKTKKLTVPQTHINGKWISGFDPMKMMQVWSDHLPE